MANRDVSFKEILIFICVVENVKIKNKMCMCYN